MNFIVHPITNEKHGLNTKAAKDLIRSYVLNYQNGGFGIDGGGGVKPTAPVQRKADTQDTPVMIYGTGLGAGSTDIMHFLPPACMPDLQIYLRKNPGLNNEQINEQIKIFIKIPEQIAAQQQRQQPRPNEAWWNFFNMFGDIPADEQTRLSVEKNIRLLRKKIYNIKNTLGDYLYLTKKEIIDCSRFKIPIIGEKIGAGAFGSIFTVSFPREDEFKKAQGAGTYLMKVLESVPVGIKEIYKKPREITITKGNTTKTLQGFRAAVHDRIIGPQDFVRQEHESSIQTLKEQLQEIQTMKQLASIGIAAQIASIWYSSSGKFSQNPINFVSVGHRTTLMYILEKGIPVDKYIERNASVTKLTTLSARITILLEKLYKEMGLINIDIKPPNMIVKIEAPQQSSIGSLGRGRGRSGRGRDRSRGRGRGRGHGRSGSRRSMGPKPLFIDCGDPNYVFKVEDIHDFIALKIGKIDAEDLRICLIFLQQLIFYEFMLGIKRMRNNAKYFIPSYTRHFVNVERTDEGQANITKRTDLLTMILKEYDYNFTLTHYSRIDNPLIMFNNCLRKYKEREVQSNTGGGKSERPSMRSRRTDQRSRPH
jgi:hypothetical protein